MNTLNRILACSLAFVPLGNAVAADRTATAVAALKGSLGNAARVEVDEVRVTDAGVACIDYRVRNAQGGTSPAHAVVQGEEVLHSTSGNQRFEKAWSDHCLGPRGGMTPAN